MHTVRVTNKKMVAFFLKNGVKPINMFMGDNDTIVFVYIKNETDELYKRYQLEK